MSEVENKHLQITKTDYLNFRFCRKNLWLEKNRPVEFKRQPLSEFELALVNEGKEVDTEAQNLFPEGIVIDGKGDKQAAIAETSRLMTQNKTLFQAAIFVEPYYIRADVMKWNEKLNGWEILEVKATTQVKREKFNNHVYDLAFQYNVCLLAGIPIKKVSVTHLNKDYKKDGDINYSTLFITEDITAEVLEIHEKVGEEMEIMIAYLNGPEERNCQCRTRTRNNHCTTFQYSNPDVPAYAVHDITRINAKKLTMLVDDGCLDITSVPDDLKLSPGQLLQVETAKKGKPFIDEEQISAFLKSLEYPLYFIDYESYLPAIPIFDRYGPYQNIVFQYSLHIMEQPGSVLKHTDFLETKAHHEPSRDLVEKMTKDIGKLGSILVWHKPFEMGRNREMAELNPVFSKFLIEVNDRIVDLKEVFSKGMYVDPKCKGSASIKKVLPVLTDLSYKDLAINNGADANKQWGKITNDEMPESEKKEVINNLLIYCKQDTFAMTEIFNYLTRFL